MTGPGRTVQPADRYIPLPFVRDVPCHVCGTAGCSMMLKGGTGEHLCEACFREAYPERAPGGPKRVPPVSFVAVAVRYTDRRWFSLLHRLQRATSPFPRRREVLVALGEASGRGVVDDDGVQWLPFATSSRRRAGEVVRLDDISPESDPPEKIRTLLGSRPLPDTPAISVADLDRFVAAYRETEAEPAHSAESESGADTPSLPVETDGDDSGREETPAPPERGPATTTGPVPLIADLSIEIASEREGWRTVVSRDGSVIAEDTRPAEPWTIRTVPGRLAGLVREAVPAYDRNAVRDAITEFFETVGSSADGERLVSGPVARAQAATVRALIETSDPPTYLVRTDRGDLIFSAREIAAAQPVALNTKWLTLFRAEPLKARKKDFEALIDYWLAIAEEIEPAGTVSPWELVAERLQARISTLQVGFDREDLVRTGAGIYQEDDGPLWVSAQVVCQVLRDSNRNENDPGFANYLERLGVLVERSRSIRVGSMFVRAWGFSPEFRPADLPVTGYEPLTGDGEEDRP
ncbi:MAG: hypothetical protein ACP5C4_07440 [Methanomicrobiales archaeon]